MRSIILLATVAAVAACGGETPESRAVSDPIANEASNDSTAMQSPGGDVPPASQTSGEEGEGAASVPMPSGASDRPAGPPDEGPEQCGADEYQWLVGQPRSRIPEQPEGANWRVACTTCPVTMDYSPARMNIFYNEETDIIEEVKCG